MSSPELRQEPVGVKLATPDSDVDETSIQDEIFAEDEEADDAGGLFGSDEEDEGLQYSATLSTSVRL